MSGEGLYCQGSEAGKFSGKAALEKAVEEAVTDVLAFVSLEETLRQYSAGVCASAKIKDAEGILQKMRKIADKYPKIVRFKTAIGDYRHMLNLR